MKIVIDTEAKTIDVSWPMAAPTGYSLPLYSKEAFELLTEHWLRVGWNQRYPYTFSWLGFPVLQIPEDLVRIQEVIVRLKPDLVIETGVAHGGSMIFYASLQKLLGDGRVIGIEKGLRCRDAIAHHALGHRITLIEGDSTDPMIVDRVHQLAAGKRVLMILDSDHSCDHVLRELEAYHDLIGIGSYIVAADGNMADLADVPRGDRRWSWNNPQEAARIFCDQHHEFVVEQPAWPYNESELTSNVTYWKGAWLRHIDPAQHPEAPPQKEIAHEHAD